MSTKVTHHLRDTEQMSLSLMELSISKCVALSLTEKDGYRTVSEIMLTTETPEQELLLRTLVEAYEKSKFTIPLELV
jgi:hypothetical protein